VSDELQQTRLRAYAEAMTVMSDPSYESICGMHDEEPIFERDE
jgi:hypothetical protein